jgi:NAD(P)-dependent dehydrogenase (short-subunit alcohol dehydrogenase family)
LRCGLNSSTPFFSAFSASKAGVISPTEGYARECGPENIRINAISSGYIDTPFLKKRIDRDWAASMTPSRKMGEPDDVAQAAIFLLSDNAKQITNANLRVHGGLAAVHHMPPPG